MNRFTCCVVLVGLLLVGCSGYDPDEAAVTNDQDFKLGVATQDGTNMIVVVTFYDDFTTGDFIMYLDHDGDGVADSEIHANAGGVEVHEASLGSTGAQTHSNWATSDNRLLISAEEISDGDIKIFDVTNPASPVLLSTLDRTSLGIDAFTPHNPVLYDDSLLFVSWYEAGVVAIDISDPANPVLVGNYDTFPGGAAGEDGNWGVYPLLGLDRVLLSDMDAGLVIVDATPLGPPAVPALPWPASLALAGLLISAEGIRRRRRVPQRSTPR